jgi:hypothetical protein
MMEVFFSFSFSFVVGLYHLRTERMNSRDQRRPVCNGHEAIRIGISLRAILLLPFKFNVQLRHFDCFDFSLFVYSRINREAAKSNPIHSFV